MSIDSRIHRKQVHILFFFFTSDITEGEELTFDYGIYDTDWNLFDLI